MPILMVALIALGVFGMVGVLLLAAMLLEQRMQRRHVPGHDLQPTTLPLIKH